MKRHNREIRRSIAGGLIGTARVMLLLFLVSPAPAEEHIPYGAGDVVDVSRLSSRMLVHLVYSTPDNFLHDDIYGDLTACYLRREAAEKLARAQSLLEEKKKGFRLVVYDCLRPRTLQHEMWRTVKGSVLEVYVADPEEGSVHNFGAAVDLTIVDDRGVLLDMGSPFDHFGEASQPCLEEQLLRQGRLTAGQLANRRLLRGIMEKTGFMSIPEEWWHFEEFPFEEAVKRYPLVEFLLPAEQASSILSRTADLQRDEYGYCLFVKASEKKIYVIKHNAIELVFDVAIGKGGLGKKREGDHKTPLGDYAIKWMVSRHGPRKENPDGAGSFIVDGKTYAVLDTELFFGDPGTIRVRTLPDGTRNVSASPADRRITPEEIAIARDEQLWTDSYGGKDAYIMALNYPTARERAEGKTGSCIEIHASSNLEKAGYRNYPGTLGCIALYPAFARRIYEKVNPGTPVRIAE